MYLFLFFYFLHCISYPPKLNDTAIPSICHYIKMTYAMFANDENANKHSK